MSTTYVCSGSVRGNCNHAHSSLNGATRCLVKDRMACNKLGGGSYSDREVVKYVDGNPVRLTEAEMEHVSNYAYDLRHEQEHRA